MSFLDRFKPQPRWKHADPAVRAAAVAEIPEDEESIATLRELASDDEDVRVRRVASERLHGAADILLLARKERDEALRRELVERLVSIAAAGWLALRATLLSALTSCTRPSAAVLTVSFGEARATTASCR